MTPPVAPERLKGWSPPLPGRLRIMSAWGARRSSHGVEKIHQGVDLPASVGTPVTSIADGKVVWVKDHCRPDERGGNEVMVEHAPGTISYYGHLSQVGVKYGDAVKGGTEIGKAGKTGVKDSPAHLHFSMRTSRMGKDSFDPMPYLKRGQEGRDVRDVRDRREPATGPREPKGRLKESRTRPPSSERSPRGGTRLEDARSRERERATAGREEAPYRDGGVPATFEQMGTFAMMSTSAEVATEIDRQLASSAETPTLRSRGTEADLRSEIGRLQSTWNSQANWCATYPALATDRALQASAHKLDERIKTLSTYLAERQPTAGLHGDSTTKVLFDGRNLIVHGSDATPGTRDSQVPAVSGRGKVMSTVRSDVSAQREADQGPIPEGTYWVDLRQWTTVLNPLERPGYGPERLTLHPFGTTETFGRGGMFLHGGATFGSKGCIDVRDKVSAIRAELAHRTPDASKRVLVVVDYSAGRERWARERLDVATRKELASSLESRVAFNQERGFTAKQLTELERSLGMRPSDEARRGVVTEALVWNIAAWQTEQGALGRNTGGVDGEIGPRTQRELRRAGMLVEQPKERPERPPSGERHGEPTQPTERRDRDAGVPDATRTDAATTRDLDLLKMRIDDAGGEGAGEARGEKQPPSERGTAPAKEAGPSEARPKAPPPPEVTVGSPGADPG